MEEKTVGRTCLPGILQKSKSFTMGKKNKLAVIPEDRIIDKIYLILAKKLWPTMTLQ